MQQRGIELKSEQLPISAIVRCPLLAIRWQLSSKKVKHRCGFPCIQLIVCRFVGSRSGSNLMRTSTSFTIIFTTSVYT